MIDPNETADDRRKRELLQSYRRGWQHGAAARARDKRFEGHLRVDIQAAYAWGYEQAQSATILALARECERLQYDPRMSVLRAAAPADPPGDDGGGA